MRAVPSTPAVTMRVPSALKAAVKTRPSMPEQDVDGAAGAGVPEPRRAVGAGGEDAPAVRAECGAQNPASVASQQCGVCGRCVASHTAAVPSSLDVTTRVPSGLNAAPVTGPR